MAACTERAWPERPVSVAVKHPCDQRPCEEPDSDAFLCVKAVPKAAEDDADSIGSIGTIAQEENVRGASVGEEDGSLGAVAEEDCTHGAGTSEMQDQPAMSAAAPSSESCEATDRPSKAQALIAWLPEETCTGLDTLTASGSLEAIGILDSVIYAEIPSEALLQVPVRSVPAMPSRQQVHHMSSRRPKKASVQPTPAFEAVARTGPLLQEGSRADIPAEWHSHSRFSELPQGIFVEPAMVRQIGRGLPPPGRCLGQQRAAHIPQPGSCRRRNSRQQPVPALGDGHEPRPDFDDGPRSRSASSAAVPSEEIADEQPLAQRPVQSWLRSASISSGVPSGAARGSSDRDIMRSLTPPPPHVPEEGAAAVYAATPPPRQASAPMQAAQPAETVRPAADAPRPSALDHMPTVERSSWQVAEELSHPGGMVAPRYLLVRLGECIPAETGAAPVYLSRLDTGPQWRNFLHYGEGRDPRSCLALDDVLSCPCCLSIYRQPIALPCGHSLCRSCFARISSQAPASRRCPLCRADFPQCDLRVNLALASVCDALRAFRAFQKATHRPSTWRASEDSGGSQQSAIPEAAQDDAGEQSFSANSHRNSTRPVPPAEDDTVRSPDADWEVESPQHGRPARPTDWPVSSATQQPPATVEPL
eukprot:gnl/TRDRNA2_/TRDRNA2_172899_c0_seq1.p1 gnl/TRDRNA2_/TRDRNA2_172899_c0~~gnl/TRDRNA2_/TRDRNA2_172899_c0_seq1.p1  ORF type:complete len:646 (+),score=95.22 gnl/TRDRNA2_/TRDRNA2_172899_c0_seq1:53-1990(+)